MHFSTPRPKNDDEKILPLINVVFLLLIFFMLAGSLSAGDPFEVAPARSASDATPGAQDVQILLGADGQLALDGVIMEQSAMISVLVGRMAGAPDTIVRLKADGRIEAARVVALMEQMRGAGVLRLKLLTVPVPVPGSASAVGAEEA